MLVLLLALCMAAAPVAAVGGDDGNIHWDLTDGTLTISGDGNMPDYYYLSSVPWYSYRDSITNVVIESGVTSIGDRAFYECSSLTSITIPSSVTSIGDSAFWGCSSLTSIDIPSSVTSIGTYAFEYCSSLTSIDIPVGVTSIGSYAFRGCSSLTSINADEKNTKYKDIGGVLFSIDGTLLHTYPTGKSVASYEIPSGVTSIGYGAFEGCSSLTSIVIPSGVTNIGDCAFEHCSSLTSITIPSSVTSIGYFAFDQCSSLISIDISSSVTSIGNSAFSGCRSLASIDIPSGVTSIGESAFSGCRNLASIDIPSGVTSIGYAAFSGCSSLTSINVDEKNTKYKDIDGVLFSNDGILFHTYPAGKTAASYEIPSGVTSIGYAAFSGCSSLTSIVIPSGVTSIGDWAFENCSSLTSIVIPSGVTSIGDWAFWGCSSLTSITIPSGVTSIGRGAFSYLAENSIIYCTDTSLLSGKYSTDLTALTVKNTDGSYTFTSAVDTLTLSEANAPAGVTYGGWFEESTFTTPVTSIAARTNPTLWLKEGSSSAVTANGTTGGLTWVLYEDGKLVISGNGAMPDYSIYDAPWDSYRGSITSVVIEDSVTGIGSSAFLGCSSLTSIILSSGVTSIGFQAFYGCSNLTTITIPSSVTSIGGYVFYGCSSLTSINVDEGNTKYIDIDGVLFSKDGMLLHIYPAGKSAASYNIPSSVTSIGTVAFSDCSSLTSIILPSGITDIGSYAFEGCSSLTSIILPSGVTNIGCGVFARCSNLTSIIVDERNIEYKDIDGVLFSKDGMLLHTYPAGKSTVSYEIPSGVTSIGTEAFRSCSNLTSITLPSGVMSVGDFAFEGCSGLTSIILPSGVTSIGDAAFFGCGSLTSITLPSGVTSIGYDAFYGCSSLTSITISSTVTSVSEGAFYYLAANSIIYSTDASLLSGKYSTDRTALAVKNSDGSYTFTSDVANLALSEANAPDNVTYDGWFEESSFTTQVESIAAGTNPTLWLKEGSSPAVTASGTTGDLTWVLYEDGKLVISGEGEMLDNIPGEAPWYSYRNSITSVVIESGVTSIGSSAFYGCSGLTSITIPSGVTSIGHLAFSYCSSLTSIAIPSSVTSISSHVFGDYSSLSSINVDEENMMYKDIDGVLFSKDGTLLHTYPAGKSVISYKIPSGVTSIGDMAFWYCSSLTSLTIPSSVTNIGDCAFNGCSSLTSLSLPSSVMSIGSFAFGYCNNLTSIEIPSGVTSIGSYAFWDCSNLTSLTIPSGVTSIGNYAFYELAANSIIYSTDASLLSGKYSSDRTALAVNNGDGSYTFTSAVANLALSEANAPAGITYGGWFKESSFTTQVTSIAAGTNPTLWLKEGSSPAVTASGTTGGLTWVLYEDGKLVISGEGEMPDYSYPDYAPWYSYHDSITSVVIEDGVTSIGMNAFLFSSLTSISIPSGVTSIGNSAFDGCSSLSSIVIPSGVMSIGNSAFFFCSSLSSIVIPSSVTSIDHYAFSGCSSLSSIVIPSSVTSIGSSAFSDCSSLTTISVDGGNTMYKDIDGVLFSNDGTLLHTYPAGKSAATYEIPTGVTSIGDYAFSDCNSLTSLMLPSSVTSIGVQAFYHLAANSIIYCTDASLLSGKYSTDLTAITVKNADGSYTFTSDVANLALSEANAPAGVTYGGWFKESSFTTPVTSIAAGTNPTLWLKEGSSPAVTASGTTGGLTWVLYEDGKLVISGSGAMPDYAYPNYAPWYSYRDLITSVVIEDGVTGIGVLAFRDCCSLMSLVIPSGVTNIGYGAFWGCSNLTSIDFPLSVTSIESCAFRDCSTLSSIVIPSGVTSIDGSVFEGCSSLTFINVDEGNTKYKDIDGILFSKDGTLLLTYPIGKSATSYVIPSGVTSIGDYAFNGCSSLMSINLPSGVTSIGYGAFESCSNLTSIIIPSGVTSIGDYAFKYCSNLTSIVIPSSVTSIGDNAFIYCSSLTSIVIPSGVTSIGTQVFYGCDNLTSIVIPSGVTSIGDRAFCGCNSLTSINLPDSVTSIGDGVFWYCSNLTSIVIPSGVTSIGDNAFSGCSSLTSIVIPSGVTSIGDSAFSGCSSLTSIEIPSGITSIGRYAFYGCSSLTSIVLPSSITSIGDYAFYVCSSLTSITILSSVTSIGDYAFYELAANSIIYCNDSSFLSGTYWSGNTALAKNNTDGSYTFTSAVTNLALSEANAPAGVTYGGWFVDESFTTPVTSIAAGTNPTLWLKGSIIPTETHTITVTSTTGGSASASPASAAAGTEITLTVTADSGYTFKEWQVVSGSVSITGNKFIMPVEDVEIKAVFEAAEEPADSLHLLSGWNFISVPKKLSTAYDTAEELFGSVNTSGKAILSYNAESKLWEQIKASDEIKPLNAYWIYSVEAKTITPAFDRGAYTPGMKTLKKGWNAVGLSAEEALPASIAFNGLNWRTYLSWNVAGQKYDSPLMKGVSGTYGEENPVSLWKGGWVYMEEDGTYLGYA